MARVRHKRRDILVLYPRHRKPYRVHHLASLLVAITLAFACVFELGIMIGHDQRPEVSAPTLAAKGKSAKRTVVRSSYGFSFAADSATFTATAAETGSEGLPVMVTGAGLGAGRPLTSATVKVKPGALSGRLAAARFSVEFKPDPATLAAAESLPENAGHSPQSVAAGLFSVNAGSEVMTKTVSTGASTLNGVPVVKTVYEFTGRHGGGKSYAVMWAGESKGRAFAVKLDGLVGSAVVPVEFVPLLDSLAISGGQAVLGASIFAPAAASPAGQLDSKYLSDALSPAVVQIFHTVCGALTLDGQTLGSSHCASFGGSGFMATRSGYIATNGHVVVYTAQDALSDLITSNDKVLQAYLQGLGLSGPQINATREDPAALAAQIAKIYDLPSGRLNFSNEGELTLVALGSDQPDIKKLVNITTSGQLERFKRDTYSIKQAEVVAYNYSSRDSLTTIADPTAGFSASDVALLKVNVDNAPAIPIETEQVVQNEKIVIMGFPGDANNPLTDNQQTDVTVTDGVVSSIRRAAGGKGKLYQSDADASHGNSGGPAIDEEGKVIGLMTYRYGSSDSGDAAKSYIRDIADFSRLARDNGVTIDDASSTQQEWEKGLTLYSRSHYSAALQDFNRVREAYPAQRLVDSYIASSKQAIAAGRDVKDPLPVGTLVIVLAAALIGAATASIITMRHHALHRVYRTSVPDTANQQQVYMARTNPAPDEDLPGKYGQNR